MGRARSRSSPLALWHLVSLDAPTVAALWTWFIAASFRISLPFTAISSMAVAVWMLYAADRLLDARPLLSNPLHAADLEHRHRFHHRHRPAFLIGIVAASVALAILIPRLDPRALRLYLVLGALLAGYLILIHATGSAHRLPKELAVGLFFAAAAFIPTLAEAPALLSFLLPAAALFALLCTLNCLFIYQWEHPAASSLPASNTHPFTRFALRHLNTVASASLTASLVLALALHTVGQSSWRLPAACALSILLLLLLDRERLRISPLNLRACADLALLTPILFLPRS